MTKIIIKQKRKYSYWELFKKRWAFRWANFKLYLQLRKRLFWLWYHNAPSYQKYLEKGAYFLRKGAIYQVGQPFHIPNKRTGKEELFYIENLYFNFRQDKLTHRLSKKPIPESELFRSKPTKLNNKAAKDVL